MNSSTVLLQKSLGRNGVLQWPWVLYINVHKVFVDYFFLSLRQFWNQTLSILFPGTRSKLLFYIWNTWIQISEWVGFFLIHLHVFSVFYSSKTKVNLNNWNLSSCTFNKVFKISLVLLPRFLLKCFLFFKHMQVLVVQH